jgi:hypothetical protein
MKESSFWPGGIHWPLRDAHAIRILVLLFVKNEQATSSPKKGYLYSALEENLPMSAQSRDLIRPNCAPAILVQQLSDCAGSTPCACSHTRTPLLGAPRQTGLLCLFALREVQRVLCVCAHYNKSRGQRTQCVLRPAKRATRRLEAARESAFAPLSASAWRSLGRLVGNVLGVGHIAVLGHWARRQVDAVAARRNFQSEPSVRWQSPRHTATQVGEKKRTLSRCS